MVDVTLSRKTVSRALLVFSLLLCGPQVQASDQPAPSPSLWASFISYAQPAWASFRSFTQPAVNYWVEAASHFPGSSHQNAPLISGTLHGNPSTPSAPVEIAAPLTQPMTPPVDSSPSDFATLTDAQLSDAPSLTEAAPLVESAPLIEAAAITPLTIEPSSSLLDSSTLAPIHQPSSTTALVANLSHNTQPAILSPTGFNYGSLLTKTNIGLAGLSILGAISVYAYKKRSAAIEKLDRIYEKYKDVIPLFVDNNGKFRELLPDDEALDKAARNYVSKKYEKDIRKMPPAEALCPLIPLVEDLALSIESLPTPSVLYGLDVYNTAIKMQETLTRIKETARTSKACINQIVKLKGIQERRRLATEGKLKQVRI